MDRLEFAKTHKRQYKQASIAKSAVIHPFAVINDDGFGLARDVDGSLVKVEHASNVEIGELTEIRAFVTIDRGVVNPTVIGRGNKIDHHCHIAHNVKIGDWNTFANGTCIEGSCVVGSYNTFGAGVIVQKKTKIGNNNIFGSGCVVTKDVGDNGVYVGNPARKLRDNEPKSNTGQNQILTDTTTKDSASPINPFQSS